MDEIGSVITGGALTLVGIILGALLQYFVAVSNYKRQKRDDEEKYNKVKKRTPIMTQFVFFANLKNIAMLTKLITQRQWSESLQ